MGWHAQPTAQVLLDGCRIPASALLGAEGQGFAIAMSGLDGGRLNIGACSLGGAQAALERTVQYVAEREQFGRPIGDLQSVQFTLAEMACDLETARAMLWRAAAALDAGDLARLASARSRSGWPRIWASRFADRALQLHGGYGYLAEYGIEKIVRDLRVHRILEGTNEVMRLIVARDPLGSRA